jgi:hypothetical protein
MNFESTLNRELVLDEAEEGVGNEEDENELVDEDGQGKCTG